MKGEIIVHTGPMFSEKSLVLLSAYGRATIAQRKVVAFKPALDYRFGENTIKSRKFKDAEIEAINIKDISEIQEYEADVYIIDEFQFLTGDVSVIQDMADSGKKFHICGLDMTAEGKPFGQMPQIMAIADRVEKLTAVCNDCKDDATYSFYLGRKDTEIVVGDGMYIPLCRECWRKRMKEKEQNC